MTEWWHALYDDWFADAVLARPLERAASEAGLLMRILGLGAGARVFDQCCGVGGLSVALAARGCDVIGVEQSEAYVARARDAAEAARVSVRFFAGDAREFVAPESVDAAFNWWTSYGYSEDDDDNARMLARACESLRPGGVFAVETMSACGVLRSFQPLMRSLHSTPRGEVDVERRCSVDLERGMLATAWTYRIRGEIVSEHAGRARLMMPDTLLRSLRSAGFTDVRLVDCDDARSPSIDDARVVAVGRRRG